jgi:hypothetical protein
MNSSWQRVRQWWRAEFLSPKDLVKRAVLIVCAFAVAHLLGLREFTSVLNGTTGSMDMSWQAAAIRGVIYIFLYLAFILLVPTLLLAAAIAAAIRKFVSVRSPSHESRAHPAPQN